MAVGMVDKDEEVGIVEEDEDVDCELEFESLAELELELVVDDTGTGATGCVTVELAVIGGRVRRPVGSTSSVAVVVVEDKAESVDVIGNDDIVVVSVIVVVRVESAAVVDIDVVNIDPDETVVVVWSMLVDVIKVNIGKGPSEKNGNTDTDDVVDWPLEDTVALVLLLKVTGESDRL